MPSGKDEAWVWPVPRFRAADGAAYQPVISDGFGSSRGDRPHQGVDVMFRRASTADRREYAAGTSDGSLHHFAPRWTPIVAARAGRVWSVSPSSRGWQVVLDHGKPWATYYQHLEQPLFPAHALGYNLKTGGVTHVEAGDLIGWMGFSPEDGEKLRHLHFEVWKGGASDAAIDPRAMMASWGIVDKPRMPSGGDRTQSSNARLFVTAAVLATAAVAFASVGGVAERG